jgi:hypothetical protein
VVLSLKRSQAVNELAGHVYSLLPGNPHPYADRAISFAGIAEELGLGRYWRGGSKLPSIISLFNGTLERHEERFCALVLEVVRRGSRYRMGKRSPITHEKISRLNDLVAQIGFKIPELHDPDFLKSLPREGAAKEERCTAAAFENLRRQLDELMIMDPQPRGYAFERFLNSLFAASGMAPREPFRLVGEQIDGSFQFQAETYLLEATWENQRVGEEELNAFSGKVGGKAEWSRGLYVSYSGFSEGGLEAFARGKRTRVVCLSGLDLHDLLSRNLELGEVLDRKVRRAAETNEAYAPVGELFP